MQLYTSAGRDYGEPVRNGTAARRFRTGAVLAAAAALSLLFAAPPARADQESCLQCKYLRCLKSTVKRKQALIGVYQGLQTFWASHGDLDANGKPLLERDLSALTEPDRSRIFRAATEQLAEYAKMEESRTAAVPAAEGCGYSESEQSVATDAFTCITTGLAAAQANQPCKQLAQLLADHEAVHVAACRARQQPSSGYWPYVVVSPKGETVTKYFPPKILTPVGAAAGEIAAYQLEISRIQPMIKELEKKCGQISFSGVTLDCAIPTPKCTLHTLQSIEGSACGDPTTANWKMTPTYKAEGCGMPPAMAAAIARGGGKSFNNDCVAAGSETEKARTEVYRKSSAANVGGWMCVYDEGPPPRITIRYFKPAICQAPAEQSVTVDAKVSSTCEEESPPPAPPPKSPPKPPAKPVPVS